MPGRLVLGAVVATIPGFGGSAGELFREEVRPHLKRGRQPPNKRSRSIDGLVVHASSPILGGPASTEKRSTGCVA
jgi:hypothetical protein